MPIQIKFPAYQSQLLRMWVEHSEYPVWRFSLEDVTTGERSGFADLDALVCHLLDVMETLAKQHTQEAQCCQPVRN